MPLPTPREDESHDDFISRCVADERAEDEFPEEDQRTAVCESQWSDSQDGKGNLNMPKTKRRQMTASPNGEVKLFTASLRVKQLDLVARTFEGLAATWELDLGGDIIEKGAFAKTLRDWKSTGRNIPLLDSHNWFSVRDGVGRLIAARETEDGLWTKWRIVPGADGDEILQRLKPDEDGVGFIDSMSIGYRPVRWETVEEDASDPFNVTRILKEVELHEVSLVLFPMNPAARVNAGSVKEDRIVRDFAHAVKSFVNRFPETKRSKVSEEVTRTLLTSRTPKKRGKKQEGGDNGPLTTVLEMVAGETITPEIGTTLIEEVVDESEEAATDAVISLLEDEEITEEIAVEVLTEVVGLSAEEAQEAIADGEETPEPIEEEERRRDPRSSRKKDPKPKPTPKPTPAPPVPIPTPTEVAPKGAPEWDDEGPDMSLYDQIRLRRLAVSTSEPLGMEE